ncbi:hypothetical protein CBR_g37879 [Chara braunii]|uniref:SURP motif domain-containing protein n=1 Tax=Chara braunii TaxID=69332 RepID=A0A388LP55_CHABU|nr:hypothetical protein CBR_g37879 [Chara braunii]|eukprot:GBG84005.1 hypothetical protein CBR_g37879 [Chara braunii]
MYQSAYSPPDGGLSSVQTQRGVDVVEGGGGGGGAEGGGRPCTDSHCPIMAPGIILGGQSAADTSHCPLGDFGMPFRPQSQYGSATARFGSPNGVGGLGFGREQGPTTPPSSDLTNVGVMQANQFNFSVCHGFPSRRFPPSSPRPLSPVSVPMLPEDSLLARPPQLLQIVSPPPRPPLALPSDNVSHQSLAPPTSGELSSRVGTPLLLGPATAGDRLQSTVLCPPNLTVGLSEKPVHSFQTFHERAGHSRSDSGWVPGILPSNRLPPSHLGGCGSRALTVHSSGAPLPPADAEVRKNIEVLALYVAKNGPAFEHRTRTDQAGNPKFRFLLGGAPGSVEAQAAEYYKWMKNVIEEQVNARPVLHASSPSVSHIHHEEEAVTCVPLPSSPSTSNSDMDMEDDFAPPLPPEDGASSDSGDGIHPRASLPSSDQPVDNGSFSPARYVGSSITPVRKPRTAQTSSEKHVLPVYRSPVVETSSEGRGLLVTSSPGHALETHVLPAPSVHEDGGGSCPSPASDHPSRHQVANPSFHSSNVLPGFPSASFSSILAPPSTLPSPLSSTPTSTPPSAPQSSVVRGLPAKAEDIRDPAADDGNPASPLERQANGDDGGRIRHRRLGARTTSEDESNGISGRELDAQEVNFDVNGKDNPRQAHEPARQESIVEHVLGTVEDEEKKPTSQSFEDREGQRTIQDEDCLEEDMVQKNPVKMEHGTEEKASNVREFSPDDFRRRRREGRSGGGSEKPVFDDVGAADKVPSPAERTSLLGEPGGAVTAPSACIGGRCQEGVRVMEVVSGNGNFLPNNGVCSGNITVNAVEERGVQGEANEGERKDDNSPSAMVCVGERSGEPDAGDTSVPQDEFVAASRRGRVRVEIDRVSYGKKSRKASPSAARGLSWSRSRSRSLSRSRSRSPSTPMRSPLWGSRSPVQRRWAGRASKSRSPRRWRRRSISWRYDFSSCFGLEIGNECMRLVLGIIVS